MVRIREMEVKSEGNFVVDEEDFRHGSIKRVEVSFSILQKFSLIPLVSHSFSMNLMAYRKLPLIGNLDDKLHGQ